METKPRGRLGHRKADTNTMNEAMSQQFAAMSADAVLGPEPELAQVLHVGCGDYAREKLPVVFRAGWREIRLDIDPGVPPDFVASITDMRVISDGTAGAGHGGQNPHLPALQGRHS